jgi:hypothetical protein
VSNLSSRLRRVVLALPLAASLAGCYSWSRRPVASPPPDRFLSGPVRVIRREGPTEVLVAVTIGRDSLFGNTYANPRNRVAIPIGEVRMVEERRLNPVKIGGVVVLSFAAALVIISQFLVQTVAIVD